MEEFFEVGPMPVLASGNKEAAWMAYCVATATGLEIKLVDTPEGGYELDTRQAGYSDELLDRASDYCEEEGDAQGYLWEPTQADLQAGYEELLAANTCLVEQGIDQPEAPSTLEEYLSSSWHPFTSAPLREISTSEFYELYRLCLGDESISFVDWEP